MPALDRSIISALFKARQRGMAASSAELRMAVGVATQKERDLQGEMQRKLRTLQLEIDAASADKLGLEAALAAALAKEARTAAWHAQGGSLLLGDGITDDTLLIMARFVPTAKDLLCLRLTNTRFTIKCIAAPSAAGGAAAAAPEMLCIPEEAGRLWVAGCSEQERGWVPRCEHGSWLGLMQEVEWLRVPLLFGRAHGDVTLSEGGAVATSWSEEPDDDYRAAASTVVMRSGCHFVRFTVLQGADILFGVIRAGWDVEGGVEPSDATDHCFYWTLDGTHMPDHFNWEGMQDVMEQGDRIGMLLDIDQGSMTVWKNGEKLGVMVAEGLSGPLCWAVLLFGEDHSSARIESATAPASPTEEELAAAKAWQVAHLGPVVDSDDE